MNPGDHLATLHFSIGEVALEGDERDAYVEAKFRSYVRHDRHFPEDALHELRRRGGGRLPLAGVEDVPTFTDAQEEELGKLKTCLLRTARRQSPLLNDEKEIGDRFTYLVERYGRFPAGTVVVECSTSRAVLYFVVETARVNGRGGLVLQRRSVGHTTPRLIAQFESDVKGTAVAVGSKIAEALTKKFLNVGEKTAQAVLGAISGGLASVVLGGLLDLIFPDNQPDFFDYLNELQQIVHQEIQQDTIVKINGAFLKVVEDINTRYQTVRNDSTPLSDPVKAETLAGYLSTYVQTLTIGGAEGVLGTLQTPAYAQIGFPAFLFGATLHLALLQEQANVDFTLNQELYQDAVQPNTGIIAKQAQTYYNFAMQAGSGVWPQLRTMRRAQITTPEVQHCQAAPDLKPPSVVCTQFIQVQDQGGEVVEYLVEGKDSTAQTQAENFVQYYFWPLQLDSLATSLGSPVSIAGAWQSLVANPMGSSAGNWPPVDTPPVSQTRFLLVGSRSDCLNPGDALFSEDESHRLIYQGDGNLVLYDSAGAALWSTGTNGNPAWRTYMQPDGNFVVYSTEGVPVFATGTQDHPDAYALVTNDGHFQIRSSSNPDTVYWSQQ